jgi:hypothetical protein
MILFSQFPNNNIISKKKNPAFFNILTVPLLVQKQMIPQQKALILSFLQMEILRAWHYQEGSTPTFFLIVPILFLYYELSVCPLILNYNKVYLSASLTAKPSVYYLCNKSERDCEAQIHSIQIVYYVRCITL